jgi:flagellum-specific ATP synthase
MIDAAIQVWPALDAFLAEDAPEDGITGSFRRLQAALTPTSR